MQKLIALDCSPGYEQNVNVLVVLGLPHVTLPDNLLDLIEVGSNCEDVGRILRIDDLLVSKYHLLLDLGRLW